MGGFSKRGGEKVRRDGQILNGFNCRTGLRNRRYQSNSEYQPAPECPWRGTSQGERSPPSQERGRARQLSYSAISTETPVSAQKAEHLESEETESDCEQSFPTTPDAWGLVRGHR